MRNITINSIKNVTLKYNKQRLLKINKNTPFVIENTLRSVLDCKKKSSMGAVDLFVAPVKNNIFLILKAKDIKKKFVYTITKENLDSEGFPALFDTPIRKLLGVNIISRYKYW